MGPTSDMVSEICLVLDDSMFTKTNSGASVRFPGVDLTRKDPKPSKRKLPSGLNEWILKNQLSLFAWALHINTTILLPLLVCKLGCITNTE